MMSLRGLEILEHAKVQVSKIFLDSDRSLRSQTEFLLAMRLLDLLTKDIEIQSVPPIKSTMLRRFEARQGWEN